MKRIQGQRKRSRIRNAMHDGRLAGLELLSAVQRGSTCYSLRVHKSWRQNQTAVLFPCITGRTEILP